MSEISSEETPVPQGDGLALPGNSPVRPNGQLEEEILGTSPERPGAMLGWVKSALSPLLSASAVFPDELHGSDLVVDDHLEPSGPVINCSFAGCKRMVGPGSSQFGCPGCGKTYCSTHSGHPSFEVFVSPGQYIRVCLACWTARPENRTGLGAHRSWMTTFTHQRESFRSALANRRTQLEARLAQV